LQKFDAFIFDVDGTLTATNELIFASFNHVANKYLNKNFTDQEIISMFGPTEEVILKSWMPEKFEEARKDYFDFYAQKHSQLANIFPGIKDAIKYIRSKGYPLSVYTGKGKTSAEITLRQIGLYDFFDMVVTGDDVEKHKPSPEGIQKFVSAYNLDPQKVLMIGDAEVDVIASFNAGVKSALVLWDNYSPDNLNNINADYTFKSVDEFTRFLKNII
jgi:pyrophosphatase PpaX